MKLPIDEIMSHKDGDCTLTVDNRYYPIVFCDFNGAFTHKSVEFFFVTWRTPLTEFAASRGEAITVIMNASKLRPPPASVRRAAGEHAAKDATTPGLLATHIVVKNPLLRGVMTAIVWVAGSENTSVKYFTTLDEAIGASINTLQQAGVKAPDIDAATYRLPIGAA